MKKKPLTLTAVAAALAAVTVVGCTPTPAPSPPPAFSTLPAPGSAVREYQKERAKAEKLEPYANAAAGLPGGVDRGLAEAAARDGVPFVFSLGGDPAVTDESDVWLRLPDRSLWELRSGGPLTRDTWFEKLMARGGGMPEMSYRTVAAPAFNAAADAAARDGRPYRWRDADACFDQVRIPGSPATFTVPDTVSTRGDALNAQVPLIGCRVSPTAPKGN